MERKKQVRKRYLLKKGFQLRFMVIIIVSMVLIALITSLSIYYAVIQTLYTEFHGENLALIKHAITYRLFMRSVLLIFAIAIISIFISHRMAGPVYKFEHTIMALAQKKEVEEIRLRKKDEFHDLAESINYLIRSTKH